MVCNAARETFGHCDARHNVRVLTLKTKRRGWRVGLNEDLDDCLRRASAAQRLAMERALAPLEITPAQFALLRLVVGTPGMSGADLARIERLTPPTVSVILANLERKGVLSRRSHPGNARVQCLEATALGFE